MTTFTEPARDLPLRAHCDVAVVGGGIAGVAAALAAARAGAEVWLLEKSCCLGGLATAGNVIVYLPLCDGRGRQVMAGLVEELLLLATADLRSPDREARFIPIPDCWRPGGDPDERQRVRYQAEFNPHSLLLELERLVVESGVKLLYDTRVCAVQRTGERVSHLVLENADGRTALGVRAVVDATGDAELCARAGEPTVSLDSNVMCGWFYLLRDGRARLEVLSQRYSETGAREDADGPFFSADTAEQVTAQLLASRAWTRAHLAARRAEAPESAIFPFQLPSIPSFRMTRRLAGRAVLMDSDRHEPRDDVVGLTGDWRRAGPVWALGLDHLRGVTHDNLFVAGRCLSAEGSAWDATRAIPTCAATGQAAGAAAALLAGAGQLRLPALQAHLRDAGVLLAPDLLEPV